MKKILLVLIVGALGIFLLSTSAQDPQRPQPGRDGTSSQPGRDGASPQPGQPGFRPPKHPLEVALDANGDGVIDAQEIANASAALKKLDKNGDGKLTEDEYRPARPMGGPGGRGGFGGPGGGGPGNGPQGRDSKDASPANKRPPLDK